RRAAGAAEAALRTAARRAGTPRLLPGRPAAPRTQPRRGARPRRLGMTFRTQLRYRFGDIDAAGIAYYPKLLHYFHCAFEDWWKDGLGHPYPELIARDRLGMPAVRLEAEFFAPVLYGDEPFVHVGVLSVGNTSVEFGFWMTRGDDPAPL